jgi:ribulose-phosphate 3-epimerase
MNGKIKPAIISNDFNEIVYKVGVVDDYVSWVHLDIMDGKFAPTESHLTPLDLELLDGKTKLEVHLMVESPEDSLTWWTKVADRVLVHFEATDSLDNIIFSMKDNNSKLGLSVLLETPLDKIEPFLDKVDFIQLMSIKKIGAHGEPFDESVIEKIKNLRKLNENVTIQVDGGINLETGKQCLEAGADILVVGGVIWNADNPMSSLQSFLNL